MTTTFWPQRATFACLFGVAIGCTNAFKTPAPFSGPELFDTHPFGVVSLAYLPDGTTLASGDGDGKIKFWQVPAIP
jgi:WD40 repeat protein